MLKRDPSDRRYPERLAGSYLTSLGLHTILAALLFTVALSSSQEGATQSISGGEVTTVERQAPVVAQAQPAAPVPAAPIPVAPKIAPIRHTVPTQPALQAQPPQKRELSHIVKNAPPLPKPIPQATIAPAPQPTTPVFEPNPQMEIAAVPVSVPTSGPISVARKIPPTIAPSPAPTIAATIKPTASPAPTAAPTAKPATPAPVAATTVAPHASPVAVAVKATAAPTASAVPASQATSAPAPKAGVPSPGPTQGATVASTKGTAPTPGPQGKSSPGPRAGNSGTTKAGRTAPVSVPPSPQPGTSGHASSGNAIGNGIHNTLAGLLGSIPGMTVAPKTKSYDEHPGINGHIDPTPPPDVLAQTKYIYETHNSLLSGEKVKMWVTERRGDICYGWQIRYPTPLRADNGFFSNANSGPSRNGGQIGGGPGGISTIETGDAPIKDGITHVPCSERALTPFTPPTQ